MTDAPLTLGEMLTHPAMIDYPVPLRGGTVIARLRLPIDFRPTDVTAVRGILYAIAGMDRDAHPETPV